VAVRETEAVERRIAKQTKCAAELTSAKRKTVKAARRAANDRTARVLESLDEAWPKGEAQSSPAASPATLPTMARNPQPEWGSAEFQMIRRAERFWGRLFFFIALAITLAYFFYGVDRFLLNGWHGGLVAVVIFTWLLGVPFAMFFVGSLIGQRRGRRQSRDFQAYVRIDALNKSRVDEEGPKRPETGTAPGSVGEEDATTPRRSGIEPDVRRDEDGEQRWTPRCYACGWVGVEVPAYGIGYYSQCVTHCHSWLAGVAHIDVAPRLVGQSELPVCPRCGHFVPNDHRPGADRGAWSRVDVNSYVCNPCGAHEAILGYQRGRKVVEMWPVHVPEEYYRGHPRSLGDFGL
jgi:hypothetical protein